MNVVTPKQMNEIDKMAITQMEIPGIVLMENAALRVVEEIIRDFKPIKNKYIIAFAGKGNNGGDAFAVARHLYNMGAKLKIYIAAEEKSITGDAEVNLKIIENMGLDIVEILEFSKMDLIAQELAKADLIIDGIFGTGLKGEVTGVANSIINTVNASGKPILSIDIPSGVCGVTGKILGTCIKAYKTVTFALPKLGLILQPGSEFAGGLVIADIGIPAKVIDNMDSCIRMTETCEVTKLIPKRIADSNKGDYGRVFIISGSVGMTGAGILSGSAALRTGAGLVYLGVPSLLSSIYDAALFEAVTLPLEDEGRGVLSKKCIGQINDKLGRMSVVAIGPGMSAAEDIHEILEAVIYNSKVPVVMDADALNVLARDISLLGKLKADAVLTPHPGEMSRLTGMSIEDIQNNRINVAREFAQKWKVNVVLKGSRTIMAFADGDIFINSTGNPGMATAGAGDVLTGIIAGLIGQGLAVKDAVVAGVYIHGATGDRVAAKKGEHGLVAGDIVEELPYVVKQLIINN
jgi:ADP-dependent NAD(P)H-hydrate dehydratase / NAD(P)H-hydrate epimerase